MQSGSGSIQTASGRNEVSGGWGGWLRGSRPAPEITVREEAIASVVVFAAIAVGVWLLWV